MRTSKTNPELTLDILSEDFASEISFDGAKFDEDNLIIRGASLTFHKSKNNNKQQGYVGRHYEPSAMKDLRTLSEGAPIFNDKHIKTSNDKHANLTEIGHVRNVTGDDVRNRGDLDLFDTDQGKTFFYASREKSDTYALSHEAMQCRATRPKRQGPLAVHSVSKVPGYVVTRDPGTNSNLFEDVEQDDNNMPKKLTAESFKADHPEIYEELLTELHAEAGTFIEGEAGGNANITRLTMTEDRAAIKKLLMAEATIERLEQELETTKNMERLRIEEAERAQKITVTTGKLVELALAEERDLSDKMKDMFIDLNKDGLTDLTETDMLDFVQELPVLTDTENAPATKKKVASRSGSDTKTDESQQSVMDKSSYMSAIHQRLARRFN